MLKQSVLFVCMGNICRSPTAHGVLRDRVAARGLDSVIVIDSAATHAYHTGSAPDARTIKHAAMRGYDLSDLRARPVAEADFDWADHILVMDQNNLAHIQAICPASGQHKVRLFTEFCVSQVANHVPDPYYGGPEDFERVLDIVEDACDGLLQTLLDTTGFHRTHEESIAKS